MTRKRRSTGSLRGRRLIKSWPSIIPKNQIVAILEPHIPMFCKPNSI
jgi:hypothetical protein